MRFYGLDGSVGQTNAVPTCAECWKGNHAACNSAHGKIFSDKLNPWCECCTVPDGKVTGMSKKPLIPVLKVA